MTVHSYRNFRLTVRYIGVARMLELQGIHSFLTLQIELVHILCIQSLQHGSSSASTDWLRDVHVDWLKDVYIGLLKDVHVGWLKDVHIGWLMIHTVTDGSLHT